MRPYYEADGITIYHGDCREVLPYLEPADMLFTDPPYGVGYRGGHFHSGDVRIIRQRDALAGDEDTRLVCETVPLMLAATTGPLYVWCAGTRLHYVGQALGQAGATIHALITWEKTNAKFAAVYSQYKHSTEHALYCTPRHGRTRWAGDTRQRTLWKLPRDATNHAHPTQKPVHLATKALRNHAADLVLDPFMGSGTTLRAAKDLGRRAIGIEIEEKYCEIAVQRLSQRVLGI